MRRDEIERVLDAGREATAALIAAQAEQIALLRAEIDELRRLISRNSNNSSLPPSRDSAAARRERPKKKGSGRNQGGQPGHPGRHRPIVVDPDRVVEYWPSECGGCGVAIGEDDRVGVGDPVAHQVTDVKVLVEVCEHRRMRAVCGCGHQTLAELPADVCAGAFGPAVTAAVATLTAARVSRRESARLLADLCGVQISTGSVERLVKHASDVLEEPYEQVLVHLDRAAVRCADETSWPHAGEGRWLSVAAGPDAALFQVAKRRDRDATRALLGERPGGTIVSDRYAVYLYIDDAQRQICLSHVLRDFVALGERPGAPGRLGQALTACLTDAFQTLNEPDRDPADMTLLQADIAPHRARLARLLEQGARGRDNKTRRFCDGLLAHENALWTFTHVAGVPATNNTAERALRHGVLWRKTSYGTQTDDGDRLVERLLTIRETCRLQRRRLHTYITEAITANLNGQPSPSPLLN